MRTVHTREPHLAHWPAARAWTRTAIRTRNPLLRLPTRRERVVTRVAFSALLVLTVVMVALAVVTFQRGAAAERLQSSARHRVTGTVQGSVDLAEAADRFAVPARLDVTYDSGGVTRSVALEVQQAAPVGSTLPLWVDDQGRLTSAPQTRSLTVRNTVIVALLGLAILGVLAAGGRAAYDEWSIGQHLDDWDVAWVRFNLRRRQ